MKKAYLDNAATTPLRPEVINEITLTLQSIYGNASSTHSFGRDAKSLIENSRKKIAQLIGAQSSEIIFTSSATEATNWILHNAVTQLNCTQIITCKTEHHATLYTIKALQKQYNVNVEFLKTKSCGAVDIEHLNVILSQTTHKTIISLMHVNNETGVVLPIDKIAAICKNYHALFHCDTVQSVGKLPLNLNEIDIDFIVASAHKFHGPKGIGFAYIKKGHQMQSLFYGGEQEKGLRAGTEGVHQIAGMAKALELSYLYLDEEQKYISNLKEYCIKKILELMPTAKINGEHTLYTVLNITLPISEAKAPLLLFNLDMKGIALSRGSACQSGSVKPSHVLAEMLQEDDLKKPSIRVSFSHYNTQEDIDYLIEALKSI